MPAADQSQFEVDAGATPLWVVPADVTSPWAADPAAPVGADGTRIYEERFSSMGTWCHVIVRGGPPGVLAAVRHRIDILDRRWTRFSADSELSRCNAAAGRWFSGSPDLLSLAAHAWLGWRLTDGAFDPFLAQRMNEVGYDRDFAAVEPGVARPEEFSGRDRTEVPLRIDRKRRRVRVAIGQALDSGGIGKGLGADLAVRTAQALGAQAVLVNLGGDLRCAGAAPPGGWQVTLDDAWQPGQPSDWWVRLIGGAVATSSPLRRAWQYQDGSLGHHLLDPRTGLSLTPRWAAVSVIAQRGWIAEVLTKAAYLLPQPRFHSLLRRHRAAAVVTGHDGQKIQVTG